MYRSFYEQLSFAWLPAATTIFFVTVFTVALIRLYVLRGVKDFEQVSALPLENEKENTP